MLCIDKYEHISLLLEVRSDIWTYQLLPFKKCSISSLVQLTALDNNWYKEFSTLISKSLLHTMLSSNVYNLFHDLEDVELWLVEGSSEFTIKQGKQAIPT